MPKLTVAIGKWCDSLADARPGRSANLLRIPQPSWLNLAMPPLSPFMTLALDEAARAAATGEVPVGAVLVAGETVLASAGNRVEALADPTAHAEMLVLRAAAAKRGSPRLADCDLYVTLEPCPMCAAAIALARLRRVYFAAYDPKGGGVEHGARIFDQPGCNHRPEIYGGIDEQRAALLLRDFFQTKR
jgi:tRNA(adenine34) deaminase